MSVCIYCRVSSNEQELEQQIAACKRFCDYHSFEVGAIFSEIVSGVHIRRPEFAKMLDTLRACEYEGVVVFRLDRLGRRVVDLILLLEELQNRGIKVFSLSENFDSSTAIGRAMLQMTMVLAELERENISDATKQRLTALKEQGVKLGRPKTATRYQIRRVRKLNSRGVSLRHIARNSKLSYGTVYNIVKKRGVYAHLSRE